MEISLLVLIIILGPIWLPPPLERAIRRLRRWRKRLRSASPELSDVDDFDYKELEGDGRITENLIKEVRSWSAMIQTKRERKALIGGSATLVRLLSYLNHGFEFPIHCPMSAGAHQFQRCVLPSFRQPSPVNMMPDILQMRVSMCLSIVSYPTTSLDRHQHGQPQQRRQQR